jgi:hypothetical protein
VFVPINTDFWDKHYCRNLSASACKLYIVILRNLIGFRKDSGPMAVRYLSRLSGLSDKTIQAALKELEQYKLIRIQRKHTSYKPDAFKKAHSNYIILLQEKPYRNGNGKPVDDYDVPM